MRKCKFKTYAFAAALAAMTAVSVPAATAHAEEAATVTDAAVESTEAAMAEAATEAPVTEEVVTADTLDTVEATKYYDGGSQHFDTSINGGRFDGTYYTLNDGSIVYNAFLADGGYTYYLQYDGTPMKDRLTYHPDGEHIIYFDANGHEVFATFAHITTSIEGNAVDDYCFFDTAGHMYVNKLTYDQSGTYLYYINPYGRMERNGWFQFSDEIEGLDGGYQWMGSDAGSYAYANADGSLLTSQFTYNWLGGMVYVQGDGTIMSGMNNIGGTWYQMDLDNGTIVWSGASKPSTYTMTDYDEDGAAVITYGGFSELYGYGPDAEYASGDALLSYTWNGNDGSYDKYEYTYDSAGRETSCNGSRFGYEEDGSTYSTTYSDATSYNSAGYPISYTAAWNNSSGHSYMVTTEYSHDSSGKVNYRKSTDVWNDINEYGVIETNTYITETYYSDFDKNWKTGERTEYDYYDGSKNIWERSYYNLSSTSSDGSVYYYNQTKTYKYCEYDTDGGLTKTETKIYDENGDLVSATYE